MPAHSFLISAAQGLPACATAAEPVSSSAVSMTNPDRIPAILDSSTRSKKAYRDISESQLRRRRRCWDAMIVFASCLLDDRGNHAGTDGAAAFFCEDGAKRCAQM